LLNGTSILQAIDGFNIDNDLVQKFIKEYSVQTKQGKAIALCWIPSHVGIPGNEKADPAANGGLSVTALKLPAFELLPRVTKLISEKWQKSWNNCTGNFSKLILPLVFISISDRYHVMMLCHTRLTHCYLLSGTDQPECLACHYKPNTQE